MFALRGFANPEIAALRNKSEATIKTQTNAIYRKAGVSSRAQLTGIFVEAMMAHTPARDAPVAAVRTSVQSVHNLPQVKEDALG